jgi:RecA/RadA recombinase
MTVRGKIRGWWPLAAVTLFLVAGFGVLYAVWHAPNRAGLVAYGGFAVAVVTLMAGWISRAWQARSSTAAPAIAGQDLDRVADLLAVAVKTQWERAAGERGLAEPISVTWGRPSRPLAGPIAAAAGSRRFAPLPGLTPVREAQLAAGQIDDLHAIYGGLRSGRLVIAGPPGSGKSSAAVLLVLAALKHRDQVRVEDRGKVPVPVLVTAQDWDPRRQPVREWLTGRLQQTYPLFVGSTGAANAGGLIDAGKLTVILDGLDEIARELRPVALQALNQVSFRVVVLSRTAEMASAASQRGVLQGAAAVELRALDPATAAGFLERVQLDPPPHGWRDLIDRIRASPASPLAEALNNPLTLTLIRDTYQSGDDAGELLAHCDTIQKRVSGTQAAEITGHLLDRVLPAAYAPRPGQPPPRYDLQTAQNALSKIAARMNQDGTRDLQWWHIPRWVPSAPRIVVGGLVAWVVAGLVFGLAGGVVGLIYEGMSGLVFGLVAGLVAGLYAGFVVGVAAGVAARGNSGPPARMGRIGRPRLRRVFTRRSLKFGFVAGLVLGVVIVFPALKSAFVGDLEGLLFPLGTVVVVVVVVGLAVGLANAFADPDSTSSPSPAISWRHDRRHAMAIGLAAGIVAWVVAGLVFGVVIGLLAGLVNGVLAGLVFGLVAGLVVGLVAGIGISQAWPTTLAAAQLAKRWHTPLYLMNFLDDAHERNVLRTVGPVYQFRHARLQDHLVVANVNSNDDNTTNRGLTNVSRRPQTTGNKLQEWLYDV